ncbi:MAG TPA: 2-oxoacid:ferredoxin oxidoreductase subunit beta [Chloroflexota bacterium]|jgi:2-oxoglutarate ferredoxin oxidoreductase subunit beta|nr:2-oxoacid:ferredoxin oxidoreductase subunit beta [Chloroflexota bacterium]
MLEDATTTVESPREFEYKSGAKPTWCPGCGDFGVLNAVYAALREKGYNPKDVVAVSGIGCSSRLPFFVNTYGFHGLHGRAMPIATGLKAANPDLQVLVFGGDGDAFAIGGDHFMHACRRNVDITYVVMDNATYGLTKGQASPTSRAGFITKTTPAGAMEQPVNPLALALICGATYVAQGFSARPKDLTTLIVNGIEHRGFSFIEVFSPCPTFNKIDTFSYYKENIVDVPAEHDASNLGAALQLATAVDIIPTGLIYQRAVQTFGAGLRRQLATGVLSREQALTKLFDRFS